MVGQALGIEARAKSCHILLAPTVNIQRSPLGGRGFESFSEDPHLNGTIAGAYINGVQSEGVAATIKHYVANDQEYQRYAISYSFLELIYSAMHVDFQLAVSSIAIPYRSRCLNNTYVIIGDLSERALREIYLKPFQIAIKASRPRALMTAYNRVNGIHVSEDKRILTDILREVFLDRDNFPLTHNLTTSWF